MTSSNTVDTPITTVVEASVVVSAETRERFDPSIDDDYFTSMLRYGIEANDFTRVRYFSDCGGDVRKALDCSKRVSEEMFAFLSTLGDGFSLEEYQLTPLPQARDT